MKKLLALTLLSLATGVIYACPSINAESLKNEAGKDKEVEIAFTADYTDWATNMESQIKETGSNVRINLKKINGTKICSITRKG